MVQMEIFFEIVHSPGESHTLFDSVISAVNVVRRVVQCPAVAVKRPLQTSVTFSANCENMVHSQNGNRRRSMKITFDEKTSRSKMKNNSFANFSRFAFVLNPDRRKYLSVKRRVKKNIVLN